MTEEEWTPRSGADNLSAAWWEALDELRFILGTNEDPSMRLRAAEIVLEYTSKLNVGLGEPYIPDEPKPDEPDEDDE